jgi:hypothetical protein
MQPSHESSDAVSFAGAAHCSASQCLHSVSACMRACGASITKLSTAAERPIMPGTSVRSRSRTQQTAVIRIPIGAVTAEAPTRTRTLKLCKLGFWIGAPRGPGGRWFPGPHLRLQDEAGPF